MRTLVIRNARWMSLIYLAGSLIFVFGGAYLGITEGDWYDWAGVVFFGLCAAFYLREFFNTEPQIIINEDGVWDAKTGFPPISWVDIEKIHTQPLIPKIIFIDVFDEEKYLQNFSDAGRKFIKIDTAAMPSRFRVDLTGTSANRKEIYSLMLENLEIYRKKLTQ